jgi:CheY-like chemotaxis protein
MHDAVSKAPNTTLLLIDDDEVSREIVSTLLGLGGYSVQTAESGEAALKLLKVSAPAVILLDAQMPGLSGIRLVDALRASCLALVVVISASEPRAGLRDAADGFLLKPFGPEELTKLLQALKSPSAWQQSGALARLPEPPTTDPDFSEPVISPETLAQLRAMMPAEAIRQIFTALAEDLDQRMIALDVARAARDNAELRRIGHAIKGGCVMAGAVQIARIAARIEAGALETASHPDRNHLDNGSPILIELRRAARNLRGMLEMDF